MDTHSASCRGSFRVFRGYPGSGLSGIEVQAAAEKVDGGLEVLPVAVTARPALDGHDLAVESLGRAVGDPMPAKGQDRPPAVSNSTSATNHGSLSPRIRE